MTRAQGARRWRTGYRAWGAGYGEEGKGVVPRRSFHSMRMARLGTKLPAKTGAPGRERGQKKRRFLTGMPVWGARGMQAWGARGEHGASAGRGGERLRPKTEEGSGWVAPYRGARTVRRAGERKRCRPEVHRGAGGYMGGWLRQRDEADRPFSILHAPPPPYRDGGPRRTPGPAVKHGENLKLGELFARKRP